MSALTIQEALSRLQSLPRSAIEPSELQLIQDPCGGTSLLCSLFAPSGVTAADVQTTGMPSVALHNRPLHFSLSLRDSFAASDPELAFSMALLAADALIDASILCGAASTPLQVQLALPATLGNRAVTVTVSLPRASCECDRVIITGVIVAGATVSGDGHSFPLSIPLVVPGMLSPLLLPDAVCPLRVCSPCISEEGVLYGPKQGSDELQLFSRAGIHSSGIPLDPLCLSHCTTAAACCSIAEARDLAATSEAPRVADVAAVLQALPPSLLVLADSDGFESTVVAIDATSHAPLWSQTVPWDCEGIVLLPLVGIIVVVGDRQVNIRCIVNGTQISSIHAGRPVCFAAADPSTGTVFVGVGPRAGHSSLYEVLMWRWTDGIVMRDLVPIPAAGSSTADRPLAVVPPARGKRVSHLVVGTFGLSTLRVLSLLDLTLVHVHDLVGMRVVGLAGDPSGLALAVCDEVSQAVHVLSWPWPGLSLDC